MKLRPFQDQMIATARDLIRNGAGSMVLQAPTGSGKTVLAAFMLEGATRRGKRCWFVVHRRELIRQSCTTLEAVGVDYGIVSAQFPRRNNAPVQVCGVQSLKARMSRLEAPDIIVYDECHHLGASTWQAVRAAYPKALHIGLSATPQRLDGKGLGNWFEHIVQGPSVEELIGLGFLSPYRMLAPPNTLDLEPVHTTAGDYNKKELSDAVAKSSITGDAVSHYRKHCMGKRAVAFHVSIERSLAAVAAFKAAGIPAAHVDGDTDPLARDAAMAAFVAGHTKILSNVGLFGEGVDVPGIEVVIDCAPSRSLTSVMQRWGRALRPMEGKTALILDHAGNCHRHGLPDDQREWVLSDRKGKKPGAAPVRTCPACFAVCRAHHRECPECGRPFPAKPSEIAQVDADLVEVQKGALIVERKKAKTLEDLIALGTSRGYKNPSAWAGYVFEGRNRRG